SSSNPGTVCTTPGVAGGACLGGGTCVANQCVVAADCGAGGTCGATVSACGGAPVVNGRCQHGEDSCNNVDEADEQCPITGGKLVAGIDDNCGCANNPVTATLNPANDAADIALATNTILHKKQ